MGKAHRLQFKKRLFGTSVLTNFYIFIVLLLFSHIILSEKHNKVLDRRKFPNGTSSNLHELHRNCIDCPESCPQTLSSPGDFHVKTVSDNYIIQYDGYYEKSLRLQYVREALKSSGINASQWGILPHTGVADLYPSDFDLIQVSYKLNVKV